MAHQDVIVIGAGSSGIPLASRLAAAGWRVLLLEAGPDLRAAELPEVWRSPNPVRALLDPDATRELVWPDLLASRTDAQPPALYWRGRGTGGSSCINGQIAIRPPLEDFADWACPGWSPQEVLPHFRRLEDDELFGDEPHHGRGGPTPIHRMPPERWGPADRALCEAALAAGHPWAEDVNAPGARGVSPYPINSRGGRRVTVNDGYLEPVRDRLAVRGGALVDRVLVEGGRAVGVRYRSGGEVVDEHADLVVLSAGAVHSPAVLMRSGFGPAGPLRELGIEVVADLPVGRGLQDHPMAGVSIPLSEAAAAAGGAGTPADRHTNVCVRWTSDEPDALPLDMMFVSLNRNVLAMERAELRTGGFGVWVNRPFSRGTVSLTSADPAVQPRVREAMLADERDRARMRAGVRALVEMACGEAAAAISAGPVDAVNEQLLAVLGDDARLDAFLLATVADAQHATSTCRMGDPAEAGTVVDPECRVLGVDGLRVVDASIFPSVPRANPNLAAIMAERARGRPPDRLIALLRRGRGRHRLRRAGRAPGLRRGVSVRLSRSSPVATVDTRTSGRRRTRGGPVRPRPVPGRAGGPPRWCRAGP